MQKTKSTKTPNRRMLVVSPEMHDVIKRISGAEKRDIAVVTDDLLSLALKIRRIPILGGVGDKSNIAPTSHNN